MSNCIEYLASSVQQYICHLIICKTSSQSQHFFDLLFCDLIVVKFIPYITCLMSPCHVVTAVNTLANMRNNTNQIVLACDVTGIEWAINVFIKTLGFNLFHFFLEFSEGRLLILETLLWGLGKIFSKFLFLTFVLSLSEIF
jgi:hypothetical protein